MVNSSGSPGGVQTDEAAPMMWSAVVNTPARKPAWSQVACKMMAQHLQQTAQKAIMLHTFGVQVV